MPDSYEIMDQPPEEPGAGVAPYTAAEFSELFQTELLEADAAEGPIRDMVAAHYAAYRMSSDLEVLPYDEHIRLPLSRSSCSDSVARFAGEFIKDRAPVIVTAVEGSDPEGALANQALLNAQWRDKRLLNGPMTIVTAAKVAYMAGSAEVFVDWVQEKRMRFGIGHLHDEELDLDGPRLVNIHPYDRWRDPRGRDIRTMRYYYWREEITQREFRARVRSGMYPLVTPDIEAAVLRTAGAQAGIVAGISGADRFDLPAQAGVPTTTSLYADLAVGEESPLYLFHRFTREKWCIGSVTGDLIREVPNPAPDGEMPIRMCMPDPDIQGPNGIPAAEASHGMNKAANSVASSYMETVRRAGTPTMLMHEGAQDSIQQVDIVGSHYEILAVPDPRNAFVPMDKDRPALAVNLEAVGFFQSQSESASKASPYRLGTSAGGSPGTATGTLEFNKQGDMQFSIPFSLFSDFVDEVLALVMLYNQSFLEKKQWLRRIGRRGASAQTYEVSRPMLQGQFEVTTTAAAGQGDPQAAQGIGALVNQFGAMPGVLDMPYLAHEFAKAVRIPNPDKAVPAFLPEPIPVETAIEMVKLGFPVAAHPADDPMEFMDAFLAAAYEAQQAGNEEEAALLAAAAQERMLMMKAMIQGGGRGQDVGNPDGSKASDKGRPVPGGPRGLLTGGASGASPGPAAPPGRDLSAGGAA